MMRFCDLSLVEVVPMLTRVPAQSIGMYPQKGSLNIGADADIVLWNADIGVQAAFIGDENVYQREVVS
jgi:N-acetylglucosamine-6-phosphate deacetylase